MWGGLSPQWHLFTCGTSGLVTLLGGSRKCLSLIGRVGRDVHDSVLPTSHWQAWKTWKHTKKEIEAKATKAGVIWFVNEDAVVQRILDISSRDEIATDVTYQEAIGACDHGPSLLRLFVALPSLTLSCSLVSAQGT